MRDCTDFFRGGLLSIPKDISGLARQRQWKLVLLKELLKKVGRQRSTKLIQPT